MIHEVYPRVYRSGCSQTIFLKLTDAFTVIRAEEVHNRDMGYFHIINQNGSDSVNDYLEENPERTKAEVQAIQAFRKRFFA